MDERALAERLISYDTSTPEGITAAAGFVKGWLESNEIRVEELDFRGLPVLLTELGSTDPKAPTVILHGHIDIVPANEDQFEPRVEGDRLVGAGACDMKGGLAGIMCSVVDLAEQRDVRVRFACVPDEEAEDVSVRSTDWLVREGLTGDFALTGEPTDLHVGIQAKGVLAARLRVSGRSAHSSTPWLGDNAVLKAIDVFRRIETLPFARESSEFFERPSINLGRINGGDAFNKVPDECQVVIDIRYLPGQDAGELLEQIRQIPDVEVLKTFLRDPAYVSRTNPYVVGLCDAVRRAGQREATGVGRDGASDAISFLQAGIPAVEFGPIGAGHHGPDEWVSVSSLYRYRAALTDFVRSLPQTLAREPGLRPLEGGLA